MVYDSFAGQSQAFLGWFKSLPGTTFHPDIKLEDLRDRNAGRGIVATADIAPDTVLFTIPRRYIICSAVSELPSKIPAVFTVDQDAAGSDDEGSSGGGGGSSQDSWTSLILIMIYEHLRGDQSPWKPYLEILPTAFDTPMFWSDAELRELQATSVASMIGRDEADRMIAGKILPVIRAHEDVFFLPGSSRLGDAELKALAHRMGSTIMAYAFDLARDVDDDDEPEAAEDGWVEDRECGRGVLGMVPMADMLNADAGFNAHINHEEGALVATSLRDIRAGDEILNYYGPVSNGELLRRYGYVTDRYRRWDAVELPWAAVAARIREQLGVNEEVWAQVEKKGDLDDVEDSFVIEWGSEDPDSTGRVDDALEFHGLPDELAEQAKAFLKALRKIDPGGAGEKLAGSDGRLGVFLTCVLRALEDRVAQYETTLEEDVQRGKWEGLAERAGKALAVRIGEKTLLREAQKWVHERLQGPPAQQAAKIDGLAAKRQKLKA